MQYYPSVRHKTFCLNDRVKLLQDGYLVKKGHEGIVIGAIENPLLKIRFDNGFTIWLSRDHLIRVDQQQASAQLSPWYSGRTIGTVPAPSAPQPAASIPQVERVRQIIRVDQQQASAQLSPWYSGRTIGTVPAPPALQPAASLPQVERVRQTEQQTTTTAKTPKNASDVEVARLQAKLRQKEQGLAELTRVQNELEKTLARVRNELEKTKTAKYVSDVEVVRLQNAQQVQKQELADVRAEIESLKVERLAVDVRSGGDRNIPPDTNENRNQLLAVARSLAARMENT